MFSDSSDRFESLGLSDRSEIWCLDSPAAAATVKYQSDTILEHIFSRLRDFTRSDVSK